MMVLSLTMRGAHGGSGFAICFKVITACDIGHTTRSAMYCMLEQSWETQKFCPEGWGAIRLSRPSIV